MAEREEGRSISDREMPEGLARWNEKVDRWFSVAATLVIDFMAFFALIAMLFTTYGVGHALFLVVRSHDYAHVNDVIVEILTVFIVVEVLSVSVRFLRANRIDLRDLVDVTLAILFREVWVTMFSGELHWQEMLGLAALVIALGTLRLFMNRQHALGLETEEER